MGLVLHTPTSENFRLAEFHPFYQQALALEANAEELLAYKARNVPYWGLIRLPLLLRLADRVRGENSSGDIFLEPRRFNVFKILNYVVVSLWRSPLWYRNKEVLCFCSGVNWIHQNGAYFNSRADYFVNHLRGRRTLLIEGADNLTYRWPRAVSPVSFRGGLTVSAAVRAKIGHVRADEATHVGNFMALLQRAFGSTLTSDDYQSLHTFLRRRVVHSKGYYVLAAKLLERLKPRMILLESAHFGFDIEIVLAARERDVKTVEYQHGAVNPACPHHNFHPRMLAAGYADCLPDYFLSYGDYWNQFLTTSAKIVSIGNPHVASILARARPVPAAPKAVFFLSSANTPHIYIEKLRELVDEGFTVTFRPHPVERPLLRQRYGTFFEDTGVSLDLSDDFYGQLQAHGIVIGDGRSTSLFEAFAIVRGRVFVMEMSEQLTAALPNHPFLPSIKSAKDLKDRLAQEPDHEPPIDALFAPNWQERFSQFASRVLAH